MKQGIALLAAYLVLILGGCGAVGVLEAENTELQSKVDSLARVQYTMKDRVGYLEQENVKLDSRNKQLRERLNESGSLAPPEYTITDDRPRYADPVSVVPLPQNGYPQQQSLTVQTYPPVSGQPEGQQIYTQQPISPNPGADQWRAEQHAVQSGAADVRPDAQDNWRPSANPRGYTYKDNAQPNQSGYPYKEDAQPSTSGYTYKPGTQPSTGGYTYKEGGQPSTGGYQYNDRQQTASADQQANWNYNKPQSGQYDREYARKFDERQAATNSWSDSRNAPAQQPRQTPAPQPRVIPAQPASPQAMYERQALPPQAYMPPTQAPSHLPPLPRDRVNVSRSEAARNADYSYLAKYQKGLDAYKDRNYTESIRILTELAASSPVNNTSDNCDFWIAEAYYALNDYNSARVYYSRVTSYPRSDKANDARARLRQIP